MMVSPEIQSRIDKVWDRLQELEAKRLTDKGISCNQIELDCNCVQRMEEIVIGLDEIYQLRSKK